MISRVKPRNWLARSVQRRRSFSFALLCCVHQWAGAAFIKKQRKKDASHLAWAATLPGRHKKTRVRASHFYFWRELAVQCEGEEEYFRPRLGTGLAGALQRRRRRRRSVAALFARRRAAPKKKRINKITMLTPQQHAPRRDNPTPPWPLSRSHLRLS